MGKTKYSDKIQETINEGGGGDSSISVGSNKPNLFLGESST